MLDEASPPAAETMAERHGHLLGRLSELSLAACEDLAARAAAAEQPALAADLHTAFAKAGRCLRQTVMLEAKLAATAARPPAPVTPTATPWTPRPHAPRRWVDREGLAEQLEGLDLEALDSLDDDVEADAEPATAHVQQPAGEPDAEPACLPERPPPEPAQDSWEWLDRLDAGLPIRPRPGERWSSG